MYSSSDFWIVSEGGKVCFGRKSSVSDGYSQDGDYNGTSSHYPRFISGGPRDFPQCRRFHKNRVRQENYFVTFRP